MSLLLGIALILVIIWILGFLLHIAGAFIHVLLILAIIIALINFLKK